MIIIKGFFPHHFNRPENQQYIVNIPEEDHYGSINMNKGDYNGNDKDSLDPEYKEGFKRWYDKQILNNSTWNFKEEMVKYCRADVELLSKAVLKYRKMFKDKLYIDPFRYVTIASLTMAIYRGCFLPDKSIVANEQNKHISVVCKEWLLHLEDKKFNTRSTSIY